jgi:cbb3-type cytochrome oxidase subunit 3
MNQVFQDAALAVEHAWVMGLMTAVFLACFIGWAIWAYLPANRARMDEAARMPLTEGDER